MRKRCRSSPRQCPATGTLRFVHLRVRRPRQAGWVQRPSLCCSGQCIRWLRKQPADAINKRNCRGDTSSPRRPPSWVLVDAVSDLPSPHLAGDWNGYHDLIQHSHCWPRLQIRILCCLRLSQHFALVCPVASLLQAPRCERKNSLPFYLSFLHAVIGLNHLCRCESILPRLCPYHRTNTSFGG